MVKWHDSLEDAEIYLEKAQSGLGEDPGRISVTLGSLSILRAADTLFLYFMGRVPNNHDKSSSWFQRLYHDRGDIAPKYNKYKRKLDKWIKSEKSKAQYKGKYYSKAESERCLKAAKRFLKKCVKPILEERGEI